VTVLLAKSHKSVSTTLSLGSVSLLKMLIEIKETFIVYWLIVKDITKNIDKQSNGRDV
jgi:hypothetical protein